MSRSSRHLAGARSRVLSLSRLQEGEKSHELFSAAAFRGAFHGWGRSVAGEFTQKVPGLVFSPFLKWGITHVFLLN